MPERRGFSSASFESVLSNERALALVVGLVLPVVPDGLNVKELADGAREGGLQF